MSAIQSGAYPVTLNGKEYGLLFSLNALDAIQDKFGGYDKLHEVFNANNQNWIKDTKWLLTLLSLRVQLATESRKRTATKRRQRGKHKPCRKVRHCTAFIYRNGAFTVQGA